MVGLQNCTDRKCRNVLHQRWRDPAYAMELIGMKTE